LLALHGSALPAVAAALERKDLSLETRQRLQDVLTKAQDVVSLPGLLRELRALEVLERIGTAEAREVVRVVAGGAPGARLTLEAQDCLRRLKTLKDLPKTQ